MELRDGRGDSYDWFFLAMAHHQLGHEDEAHKWYDKAVEWMDAHQSDNQELFRFRAEAEETLGINRQDAARRFPPPPPLPTNRNN